MGSYVITLQLKFLSYILMQLSALENVSHT